MKYERVTLEYQFDCSRCEARSVGIDERFEEMNKIIEAWNRRVNDGSK